MNVQWLKALGKMTYGIYVLTACYKDQYNGMIASWVSQISYEPPMIMAALHPDRYSHHLVEKSSSFAVHIISREQNEYMERFKGKNPEKKFEGIAWEKGRTGVPILKDCIAFIECSVKEIIKPGNHSLFIGEVIDAGSNLEKQPFTTMDYNRIYTGKN